MTSKRIEGWATRYRESDPYYFKPGDQKPRSKAGEVQRATLVIHTTEDEEGKRLHEIAARLRSEPSDGRGRARESEPTARHDPMNDPIHDGGDAARGCALALAGSAVIWVVLVLMIVATLAR